MRKTATATMATIAALALSACAAPEHRVAERGDLLQSPLPETLGETIAREQREGCLKAGRAGDGDCRERRRDLSEIIQPPDFPDPPAKPLPPSGDD
ncbi:hypothetical protein [Aurantiacibacter spongiae]|uniref:EexN family lipoprotein n=1 Tax=Aurantiacibacter spongiae TaxID=2488860 RepID=A0A3N5DB60_9SPHN|nr:hypothetical protein [Aurantiacibacter spongiae]RPF71968.1 hypothetical protein EG799_10345 [Aurantiacibacter spongiae]